MLEFGGLWKHEKTQHALYNYLGMDSVTLLQMAFLVVSNHGKQFSLGQQNVQKN